MQVATQRRCGHRYLLILKVIARRERDIPAIREADVSTHVQVLRELIRITHRVIVELATVSILTHRDTIAETQRPRHRILHEAVFISLGLTGILLSGTMLARLKVFIQVRLYVNVVIVVFFVPVIALVGLLVIA